MLTSDDFEHCGSSLRKSEISALEKKLGIRLPDDYREFLLRINGGRPCTLEAFDIGTGDSSLIGMLYSVRRDDGYDELTIYQEHLVFEDRIPDDLLPIGEDQGGSQICLGIGKENRGKVFFWDMEYEDDQPTYDNVYPIAESFGAFLDSLYNDEDD